MDNPVVVRVAEVAGEEGLATLRFNFRGVGASSGDYDNGSGEQDDIRAALAAVAGRLPAGVPLGLCGYSFGAWVAARAAAGAPALAALALIAPPLGMFDWDAPDSAGRALLLVAGTRDPYCPAADLERFAARVPGAECLLIKDADHFFFGKLYPLGEAVRRWVRRWCGPA